MTRLALERPDQADVVALVEALDAYQQPLYPPESHHGIDIAALCAPEVLFAVLRDEVGVAFGCGAVVLGSGLGELKRFYLDPARRGLGHAARLLAFLEQEAARRGCRELALETGTKQAEALALYGRAGYRPCAPFGDYTDDPHSIFMRKALAPAGTVGAAPC